MNAVGIDVSKGKSMITVMRPFGEVVASPFEVTHTASELGELASYLVSLDGETKVGEAQDVEKRRDGSFASNLDFKYKTGGNP